MTLRTRKRFRLSRRRAATAFAANADGGVTVFSVISFAMLMVMVGLVVDVGRVMSVHSQVNSYVDRVALAAATELDGRPGAPGMPSALQRAVTAARGNLSLVDDPGFRFSLSGDTTTGVRCLTFLSALGPDPADPYQKSPVSCDASRPWPCAPNLDCATATWTPAAGFRFAPGIVDINQASRETSFIIVDPEPETERYIFFPLLGALAPDIDREATVAPQAVAGFQRRLCNSTPLMLCNIAEALSPGSGGGVGAPFNPNPRQMIRARPQGGGNDWAPGVYTAFDIPNITTSSSLRTYMARIDPGVACFGNAVVARRNLFNTGSRLDAARQGLNTRFDMFSSALISFRDDPQYRPARSVTKGLDTDRNNNSCTHDDNDETIPFPRDNCLMPGGSSTGCISFDGVRRAGNGNWDRNRYWNENHPGQPRPPGYGSGTTGMSRYDVYRWEIDNNSVVNEPGRCSNLNGTPDNTRDRRVIPVAIVNCRQYETALNNGIPVPVEAYAEAFMTEPAGDSGWDDDDGDDDSADLFIEVIGTVRPNLPESKLREFPVLYR